jgi:6-phosphogluconolactonase
MQLSLQLIMAAVPLTTLLAVAAPAPTAGASHLAYFGTYTSGKSQGIYFSRFDPKSGVLMPAELAVESKNPSFLALHPSGKVLYAVGEIDRFGGKPSGVVSAFRVEPGSGRLTLINQQSSGGTSPCHLSVDSRGRALFTANYGNGSIASLPLQPDGSLGAPLSPIQHSGSSINPGRQSGPHAHFILPDPRERYVLACDLGLDQVLSYRFDSRHASLTPNNPPFTALKPGAGPRHLAFQPNGKFLYVINELDSTLTSLAYVPHSGIMKRLGTVSTLPADFTGKSFCAEVAVHPSGKFVYGSNRGHDSIAIFSINTKTGQLTPAGFQSTGGKTPRHFTFDSTGHWLLAANQDSHNVCVFRIDPATGAMAPVGQSIEVASAVCILLTSRQP